MDHDQPVPSLAPHVLDRLQELLHSAGPAVAINTLCDELKLAEDYQALFYAMLLRKRVELGVSPFPTGPATELPESTHDAYEQAIREAGRTVGQLYLERRQFSRAWGYFRMLGETERMREALETYEPGEDEDTYSVVEIAWQQGAHPKKGFDLILDRHGICSAITMVGSTDLSQNPDLRNHCIRSLVRALHAQLLERLQNEFGDESQSITDIVQKHPDLCEGDIYHIDISHLQSVVQMSTQLDHGPELTLAMELCDYGAKLSPNLRGDSPAPFDRGYPDYRVFLSILAGHEVEAGLAHFRAKLPAAREDQDTYPAEVLVNLLLRINRLPDALEIARAELAEAGPDLSCPSVTELARKAQAYSVIAEVARAQGDPVNYLAGLIAAAQTEAK